MGGRGKMFCVLIRSRSRGEQAVSARGLLEDAGLRGHASNCVCVSAQGFGGSRPGYSQVKIEI